MEIKAGTGLLATVAVIALVCTQTWAQEGYVWREQSISTPPARSGHAMCFDSVRGEVVLFGGELDSLLEYGDTWTYDGSAWLSHGSSGPSPRSSASMAFDEARGMAVLFGGSVQTENGRVHYSETWLWNGAQWELATDEGPDPRNLRAMVYDSVRERIVLVGGVRYDADCDCWVHLQDTWEWDGSSWIESTAPPMPWANQTAFFDAEAGQTLVFGGSSSQGGGQMGDTYTFDGTDWTPAASDGPSPRMGAAGGYSEAKAFGVLFGGRECSACGPMEDLWVWRNQHWIEWTGVDVPPGREGVLVYDSNREVFVLYGGLVNNVGPLDDHWEFELCPVDLTQDGEVNTLDFLLFLGAWSQRDPVADWDSNGTINTLDFLAYLNEWVAGC